MSSVVVAGDCRAVMKLLRMVMRSWYIWSWSSALGLRWVGRGAYLSLVACLRV